jgi:hypothetical protein
LVQIFLNIQNIGAIFPISEPVNGQRASRLRSIFGFLGPPFQPDMYAGSAILLIDLHKTVVIPIRYLNSLRLSGFERKRFFG